MAYFSCAFGDCKETALQELNSFVVTDAQKRHWFCYEREKEETGDDIVEMVRLQRTLHNHGMADGGTTWHNVRCDRSELPKRLGEISGA